MDFFFIQLIFATHKKKTTTTNIIVNKTQIEEQSKRDRAGRRTCCRPIRASVLLSIIFEFYDSIISSSSFFLFLCLMFVMKNSRTEKITHPLSLYLSIDLSMCDSEAVLFSIDSTKKIVFPSYYSYTLLYFS